MLKAIRAHEPRGRPPQARGSAGLGGRAAGRDDVRRVSFIRECSRAKAADAIPRGSFLKALICELVGHFPACGRSAVETW